MIAHTKKEMQLLSDILQQEKLRILRPILREGAEHDLFDGDDPDLAIAFDVERDPKLAFREWARLLSGDYNLLTKRPAQDIYDLLNQQLTQMPLHFHDDNYITKAIAIWRLKLGR